MAWEGGNQSSWETKLCIQGCTLWGSSQGGRGGDRGCPDLGMLQGRTSPFVSHSPGKAGLRVCAALHHCPPLCLEQLALGSRAQAATGPDSWPMNEAAPRCSRIPNVISRGLGTTGLGPHRMPLPGPHWAGDCQCALGWECCLEYHPAPALVPAQGKARKNLVTGLSPWRERPLPGAAGTYGCDDRVPFFAWPTMALGVQWSGSAAGSWGTQESQCYCLITD